MSSFPKDMISPLSIKVCLIQPPLIMIILNLNLNMALIGFYNEGIVPMNSGIKFYLIRVHVATSVIAGVIFLLQLQPWIRNNYISFHRFMGKLAFPFYLANNLTLWYIYIVTGTLELGLGITVEVWYAQIVSTICYPLAIYHIRNKNVKEHRKYMILNTSAFFIIVTQRFLWTVISSNNLLGKFTTWPEYRDVVMGTSGVLAMLIHTIVGIYFAFYAGTSSKAKAMKE
jgi:hypothetical protein